MAPVDPHLFHPEQLRTAERVARLDPPRAYWAGCALCGTSVDLATPARRRRHRAGPGTPPQPVLVSAPTSPGGTTAFFDFTVAESGVGTQCSLDGAAFSLCTTPVIYSGLTSGAHAVEIRAVDAAGNLSAVRRHDWTVDIDLPSVGLVFP